MLLWLLLIGGGGALVLAVFAIRGPSASKALKRRIELVKERHGDVISGNAQAQIRKLFAAAREPHRGLCLDPDPQAGAAAQAAGNDRHDITLAKYSMICLGIVAVFILLLLVRGAPILLA